RTYARGLDKAGNIPADPAFTSGGVLFTVDSSTPISVTTAPVNASYLQGMTATIAGTATDSSAGGSGVASVFIRIGRSDGLYFNPLTTGFDNSSTALNF